MLRCLTIDEIPDIRQHPVDSATLARAAEIVERVRTGGESAIRELAVEFGDLEPGSPLVLDRTALETSIAAIDGETGRASCRERV